MQVGNRRSHSSEIESQRINCLFSGRGTLQTPGIQGSVGDGLGFGHLLRYKYKLSFVGMTNAMKSEGEIRL